MSDVAVQALPFSLPIGFGKPELDALLYSAAVAGAADISLASGEPVVCNIDGDYIPITTRRLQHNEIVNIAKMIYGDNVLTLVSSSHPVDPRYSFRVDREKTVGFRVNITSGFIGGNDQALQITCRALPAVPKSVSELKVVTSLVKEMFTRQGLVFIAGETGSGKSTLVAAVLGELLLYGNNHKIITYEAPIEYTFDKVDKRDSNFIYQHEVGVHVSSFAAGVSNVLRRAPTDALIGESRDRESISATIELALTGCKTFTTVHAESPGGTIARLVQSFDYVDHAGIIEKLVSVTRLVVVQRLCKTVSGKRTALNGWLVFDPELRARIAGIRSEKISTELDAICFERGTSVAHHAAWRVKQGEITLRQASHATGFSEENLRQLMDTLNPDCYLYKEGGLDGIIT